jgi:hypothetical protein
MGEMGPRDHRDDEFERLLNGQPSDDASSDLAELVEALRLAARTRATDVEDAHVAAMVGTAAHLRADEGDPATTPASTADAPASQVLRLPKRGGNTMKGKVLKPILSKGLAPVFALLTIFSGMAYAGVLPTPLQNAVESVVGADDDGATTDELDDPGDVDDEQGDADDQGEDGDDQGEDGDHQGEDGDHQGQNGDREEGDADDQGEDAEDQGEDGDDQGEDADDQGDNEQGDGDDQGENEQDDEQDHHSQGDDDQGEEDDSQGEGGDQGNR